MPPRQQQQKQHSVESVSIELSILRGENLTAKDRSLFGKKSSDPYVKVVFAKHSVLGKTKTIKKNLSPTWNHRMQFTISGKHLNNVADPTITLQLQIFDEDQLSADDLMGVVTLHIPTTLRNLEIPATWYDVPASSAKNAKGRLQVSVKADIIKSRALVRGNAFELTTPRIMIGLAWDMLPGVVGRSGEVDLDVSCVAVTAAGQISMRDTVYYGNLSNTNGSVTHSGDEKEGDEVGDDERLMVDLYRIPPHIIAMYLVLSIATPNRRFPDVQSAQVRIVDLANNHVLCTFCPARQALARNATAMFVARLGRSANGAFEFAPIEDSHPTARDFGPLVPHMKRYTQDLLPGITVDPTERIAIMRKGGNVRLEDYCKNGTIPSMVTFGLAWDVTNGVNIDLDASAVCLDRNLQLVDQVWFKQLKSKDGSIVHGGDEREGDELGDDEKMDLFLGRVDPRIEFIGFVINSYSGQELDDVSRASCHLFDPKMDLDIANYAMTNCAAVDGYTALVVACLYRDPANPRSSWGLSIISEPAMGRTVRDNVDELQNFLRRNPPKTPPMHEEEEIDLSGMPEHVPLDEEIDLSKPLANEDAEIDLSKPPPVVTATAADDEIDLSRPPAR